MGREGWSQRRGEGFVFGMRVGDGRASRVGGRSHSPYDHVIVHLLHHLDELLIRNEELGVEPAMVRARHRASPNPRARCLEGCRCHAPKFGKKGRWVVTQRLDAGGSSLRRGASSPLFDDAKMWEVRARLLWLLPRVPSRGSRRPFAVSRPGKRNNSSQSAGQLEQNPMLGSDAFVLWSFS